MQLYTIHLFAYTRLHHHIPQYLLLLRNCILFTCLLLEACTMIYNNVISMQLSTIHLFAIIHSPSYCILLSVCSCILFTCFLLNTYAMIYNDNCMQLSTIHLFLILRSPSCCIMLSVRSCILFICFLLWAQHHTVQYY